MNRKCFRLIFSKVLGFLIPVAEITTSQGKKSQGTGLHAEVAQPPLWPLLPVVAVLRTLQQSFIEVRLVAKTGGRVLMTALVFAPGFASAQMVVDPAAGINKPNVVAAANGVPVIEIVNPNTAGLSHNKFQSFDVAAPGAVFNNSMVNGATSIGGFTMKNPKLAQEAKGILVDVTGTNPSSLGGTLEVFGKKADLFISNQNGITLNGVTTLNANSLTATTGKPIVSPTGLQFSVNNGRVTVGPAGVDTTGLSYFDIVARTIALQGPVGSTAQATDIKAIAGLNTYDVASRHADTNSSSAPGTPAVAIDGTLAGAMYGRNISLVSTETGAGVRHAGLIRAAQDISISAQGDISVATLQAGNQARLNSAGSIQVGSGVAGQGITAGQAVTLNAAKTMTISNPVQGDTLSLTATSLLVQAAKLIATSTAAPGPVKSVNIKVGDFTLSGTLVAHNLDGSPVAANQPLVISDGKLQVQRGEGNYDENFRLDTTAMVISHNGVNIQADTVVNDGGIVQDLSTGGINLLTTQLTNKGIINTHGDMKLVSEVLNNLCTGMTQQICAGILADGKADLQAGKLTNQAGLVAGNNLDLTLKDQSTNGDLGAITAKGQLNIKQAAGNTATLVSTGQIVSGGDLLIILDALSNASSNAKIHAGGKATFQISASLTNAGMVEAAQDIDIAAGDFSNRADSTVMTDQNLQIVTKKKLELGKNSNVHAGVTSKLSAGTVLQNAAVVTAGTTLDMHADDQLINDAGTSLASQVLNISGDQLTNKAGSLISVDDQLNINVKGDVSNAGQSFMLSGGDISIVAGGNVSNLEGSVVSATKNVVVNANNVTNSGKALGADATENDVSTITGADVTIKAHSDVRNAAKANILATGKLDVQADGSVSNVDAQMTGSEVQLTAGTDVTNHNASIVATTGKIAVQAGGDVLNNTLSVISAKDALSVNAKGAVINKNSELLGSQIAVQTGGDVLNDALAVISAKDALSVNAKGSVTNKNSDLEGSSITIDAGTDVINQAAGLIKTDGNLDIKAQGAVTNLSSQVQGNEIAIDAGSDVRSEAGAWIQSMSNLGIKAGKVISNLASQLIGTAVQLDAGSDVHNKADSAIVARDTLDIQSGGSVTNQASKVQGGHVKMDTQGAVTNADKATIVSDTDLSISSIDALRNDNGSTIVAAGDVDLVAGSLANHAGSEILGNKIGVLAHGDISNEAAALIKATGALDIKTDGALINTQSGLQGRTVVAEVKGDASNASGALIQGVEGVTLTTASNVSNDQSQVQGGSVVITASQVTNSHQAVIAGKTILVNAAGAVSNDNGSDIKATTSVAIGAQGALTNDASTITGSTVVLDALQVTNTNASIAGDTLHINSLSSVLNTVKSTIVATAEVVVAAVTGVLNDDSLIKGPVVKMGAETIDNAAGANILGDSVTLTSGQGIKNRDSAIIKGDTQVTLDAQGDVINSGNATITTPKLTVDGTNVSNIQGGKVLADTIAIQAKNDFVSDSLGSMKGNKIAIDTTHFRGANSEILADDDIDIHTADYANTANISSSNTATLTIKNDGNLNIDEGHRAPLAKQLLTLNAHDVTTNAELNNPGSIHINAAGSVHNNQGIVTGKSLVVKAADAIENAIAQTVFAAQDITLEAGSSISNLKDALIMALGNVSLTATEVKNDLGRITSGESMSIDADKITNQGTTRGGPVITGYSSASTKYEWEHSARSTWISIDMMLPVYISNMTVTQAVIESGGDLNINQGAKRGKGGQVINADSLMTAAGNINVDGNLLNKSTVVSKSIYELLNEPAGIVLKAKDSLAAKVVKKVYNNLWELLAETYQGDDNHHTIFAAYKYTDGNTSAALQTIDNPVFNQLMSAAFGADWKGLSRDEMSQRFNNIRSASLSFSGDKPAEIAAGGKFTQTGGAFNNGGLKKEQQTVQVKVGDKTISTIQGDFNRQFNNSLLFDDSKTPRLVELTAAMNPQNVIDRLTNTASLFTTRTSPPPLVLELSDTPLIPRVRKGGPSVAAAKLGNAVMRVNTEIDTATVAAPVQVAYTPIYPLYETRIEYIDQSQFFGSQYFFDNIGYHSDRTVPVIGDAFFDNQLITQTIQDTVGGYFAAKDGVSGATLVKMLMDNAADAVVAQGLHFGVPLTETQYAKLTRDIIWYEPVVINGQTVLSPKVYLSKATLADVANNKETTALVASKDATSIDATNVSNVDGTIRGGSVDIKSAGSIHNQNTGGGTGGIFAGSTGTVALDAKGDVSNIGSTVSGKDVAIHTEGSFTDSARMGYDDHGSLVLKDRGRIDGGENGSVSIGAAGDVNLTAAGISAKHVSVQAGGNLNSNDVHEVSSNFKQTVETNGFNMGKLKVVLGKTINNDKEVSATSVGSQLQGGAEDGSLTLRAGKNITLKGGDYSADQGLIEAKGDVKVLTGQDFNYSEQTMLSQGLNLGVNAGIAGKGVVAEYGPQGASARVVGGDKANNKDAGPMDGGKPVLDGPLGAKVGYQRVETKDTRLQVQNQNAQLNFGSSATLQGAGTVDIGGADIQAVKDGKAGDLSIVGSDVISTKYEDEDVQTHSRKELFVGGSVTGSSSVADTVNHSTTLADKAKQGMTVDAGMTALQAAGDATNLIFNDIGAITAKRGIKITDSTSSSRSTSENINTLKGNIKITSTQGDIKLAGVTLDGTGAGVELDSARNVSLSAAKSTSKSQSSTLTHEVSESISASAAPTGAGIGVSVGYSGSLDETKATGVAYQNAQVLGDKVVIKAKKDLELTGAKVTGNDVGLDIAGNTRVTSVQDTSDMKHTVGNWGGSAGVALTTTSIVAPTGGANGGGGKDTDHGALTAEQSGITAKNTLNANIGGDLNLKGAHLISQSGQGELNVAGKIKAEQLQDSRNKDGGSGGGGGGLSKTGLASVSLNVTRVDQVHYDATQNATIAGLQIKSGQGVEGPLNRDADKTLNVTRDKHIAGNDVSITAGIADVKGMAAKAKTKKPVPPAQKYPKGIAWYIPNEPVKPKPKPFVPDLSLEVVGKGIKKPSFEPTPKPTPKSTPGAGRNFDSVEFSQVKNALAKVNVNDKQGLVDLKNNPIRIELDSKGYLGANGKPRDPIIIKEPKDIIKLHGQTIDTGARAKGLELPKGVGESTKVYVHVKDEGNGKYSVKYDSREPGPSVPDTSAQPFKASPAPKAPAKAAPGEPQRTTKVTPADTAVVKPPVAAADSQAQKKTNTNGPLETKPADKYDSRVIVKLESDPATDRAAQRIHDKHPENSVLRQRDAQGQHSVVAGDPQSIGGKTKVELVGHGDGTPDGSRTLGRLDADGLAQEVGKLREGAGAPVEVKKVTVVGCDTGNCADGPSLASHVGDALHVQGIDAPIKGYDGKIDLTADGHKRPVDAGGLMMSADDGASDGNATPNLELRLGKPLTPKNLTKRYGMLSLEEPSEGNAITHEANQPVTDAVSKIELRSHKYLTLEEATKRYAVLHEQQLKTDHKRRRGEGSSIKDNNPIESSKNLVEIIPEEFKALNKWTYNAEINEAIRSGKPLSSEHIKQRDNLVSLLHRLPSSDSLVLWRGVSNIDTPKKGAIISDKGFVSTSTDPITAEVYAGLADPDGGIPYNPIIYKIKESVSGKDISELSASKYFSLKEVLFEPEIPFKVTKIKPRELTGLKYTEVTIKEVSKKPSK
ncbi:hypothetical protein A3218_26095 [Pseudomonas chlororaphis]|uniref:two-partner secretion domain-containing protein n=1 Tax=Pseudomonas chlororaphis TaxID=587753 RepID=UPI000789E408|nr:C80 family cysteine peptidase [Pseudomonas chlororaphis]AMS17599.1 hypothetical protein A3218_26095 [Pseudomonas chlororaphis]